MLFGYTLFNALTGIVYPIMAALYFSEFLLQSLRLWRDRQNMPLLLRVVKSALTSIAFLLEALAVHTHSITQTVTFHYAAIFVWSLVAIVLFSMQIAVWFSLFERK